MTVDEFIKSMQGVPPKREPEKPQAVDDITITIAYTCHYSILFSNSDQNYK